ncbi:MAG TPA: type VII secretion-associated serine protease mycosin [Mycobacterium sp.]|jgi:membrane-anchored mycosin MYCP|nr:type VII secretion-associated serine protease mycosin [Mycobacterium sp.]HPX38154.1 type VII secretion-associated serine protease mycosin [Mycobacterium sp.]HQC78204.1 type VII secretion-associated serine protease mycosin [Mycobacterium sp.]
MDRRVRSALAAATAVMVTAVLPALSGTAAAITPPVIDPGAVPADGQPGPDEAMQQRYQCPATGLLPDTDLAIPVASQAFMDLPALWKSAGRGAGVTVAVVDTGVNPSVRLPHLRGEGDYVDGGDGLTDCDTHGTVIASIIGAAPAEGDALVGVAPDAELLSIRQSSGMYVPANPGGGDTEQDRRAGTVSTLARAIVHAANAGARVINVSVVACIPTLKPVDQTTLGAAVRYAAIDKDAVLVAAAGNTANPGCAQNPDIDATDAADPRNWDQVVTISTPAWFSDYVLSVSATDAAGQPAVDDSGREISLAGPWISVAAPGLFVEGVNREGGVINATFDSQKNMLKPMSGTSFSAAYVSGLAALIRAKYPQLPAAQVINRITATAHSPAAVVDNRVGHGVIDPLAALNFDVPEVPAPRESVSRPLAPPPAPPPVDGRPKVIALVGVGVLAVVLAAVLGIGAMANTKGGKR